MKRNGNTERENRGAEEGGVWGGGIPLLSGEGAVPPTQKFFLFFVWQWCILVHSGCLF